MKNKRHTFQRVLSSYLLVAIAPLLIIVILYAASFDIIEDYLIEINQNTIETAIKTIENDIDEVYNIIGQAFDNSIILNYLSVKEPFSGTSTYRTKELLDVYDDYTLDATETVLTCYTLYSNSRMAFSRQFAYAFQDFFADVVLYPDLSYDQVCSKYMGHSSRTILPEEKVLYLGKEKEVVTLLQPIGYGSNRAVMAFYFDKEKWVNLFRNIDVNSGGNLVVYDQKNTQVFSYQGENPGYSFDVEEIDAVQDHFSFEEDGYIITYIRSDNSDWKYVVTQPKTLVFSRVLNARNIVLILCGLAALISGSFMLIQSQKRTRFLNNMADLLDITEEDKVERRDIFHEINHSLEELIVDKRSLERNIESNRPYVKSAIIESLLKGRVNDGTLRVLKTESSDCPCAALLININTSDEDVMESSRVISNIVINDMEYPRLLTHYIDHDKLLLIAWEDSSRRNELNLKIDRLIEDILKILNNQLEIQIIVGTVKTGLDRLFESYGETENALLHQRDFTAQILRVGDVPRARGIYRFSETDQKKITNFVTLGKTDELKSLLTVLYDTNISGVDTSINMMRLFLMDLHIYLIKLNNDLGNLIEVDDRVVKKMHGTVSKSLIREIFILQKGMYLDLIREVNVLQKTKIHEQAERIRGFVDEKYGDFQMSLSFVADAFNMNEVYLSRFFSEHIGISLSTYVEDKRMVEAEDLLTNSNRGIGHISRKVGFLSLNSFSRAFKRRHGISATDYREQYR